MFALFFALSTSLAPNLTPSRCQLCIDLTQLAKDLLGTSTQEEIQDYFLKLCNGSGLAKSKCVDFVKEYLPKVFDKIDFGSPSKICTYLKQCKRTRYPAPSQEATNAASKGRFYTEQSPEWSTSWQEPLK